jgi:Terpene synthase family 2, C-terminal metal binding
MKRTSEHREQWLKDVPKIKALKPHGMARTNMRFRLVPTHPDSERLDEAFYAWALQQGIYTAESEGHLRRTRMGHLMYWLAPFASAEVRWLVGKFQLWVVAIDDALVEQGAPLDEMQRACDEVMRTGKTSGPSSPFTQFFVEFRDQIIAFKCEGLLPQIADEVWASFDAWKQEQAYIKEDHLPTLAEYIRLRARNGCLYGPILTQRCDPGYLPPDKRYCERLNRIAELVDIVVSLNGDAMGVQKDIEDNYPINVIPVLAMDFGVDLVTAYLMSLDLLDIFRQMFDTLVADVCHRPGAEPETSAEALSMSRWPDGFHTWHMTNARHSALGAPDALKAEIVTYPDVQENALLRAVSARAGSPHVAVPTESERLGANGLGTSGIRFARSSSGAEMLREWAMSLLGWSTLAPRPASGEERAKDATPLAPATAPLPIDLQPTGLGTKELRRFANLGGVGTPAPAPAWAEIRPTGLGTTAASFPMSPPAATHPSDQ